MVDTTTASAAARRMSNMETHELPGGPEWSPVVAEVLSWGANDALQLGYGEGSGRKVPGPVILPRPAELTQVAAGYNFGLVLTNTGLVWGWGANTDGQLGNNSTTWSDRAVPVQLPGGAVTAIAAGAAHGIALTSNGDVYTWGGNKYGQLGIGDHSLDKQLTPVKVNIPWTQLGLDPNTTVKAIAAGAAHCLALTSTQQVIAWGHNAKGQLGNGDNGLADEFSPVLVKLADQVEVIAIAAGREHSLAITTTDGVLAWGSNLRGQLGNPQTANPIVGPMPVQLPPHTTVTAIAAGLYHSLARTADGNLLAFGDNLAGQLGDPTAGEYSDVPVPVKLPAGVTVDDIAAGGMHSLARTNTAAVLGWGANQAGQLGDGTTQDRNSPVWAKLPSGVQAHTLAAGSYFSVALVLPGPKLAWGYNATGQLGNDDPNLQEQHQPVDVKLENIAVFTGIAAGYQHSLAVTEVGHVLTWGSNQFGQLGLGPDRPGHRDSPVEALMPEEVIAVAVAAGADHSLALTIDGKIFAWGRNNQYQLGLGPAAGTIEKLGPVEMLLDWLPAGATIVAIAAYNLHSLALLDNGDVYGFGDNGYGQLGVNDKTPRDTPTKMQLPAEVKATAIAAGGTHSLVVTDQGTVFGCGYNYYGQLGTGDNQDRLVPDKAVVVPAGVTGITTVAAGIYFSLAISTDGKALGFGNDYYGELGNGNDRTTSNTAVYVKLDTTQLNLPSDTTIAGIAGGSTHSLAVTNGGVLLAWGANANGQLGDTTTTPRTSPVRVQQDTGVTNTAVAGGLYHSLAR